MSKIQGHLFDAKDFSNVPHGDLEGRVSSAHNKVSRFYVLRKMVQEREEVSSAWQRWEDSDLVY